MKRFLIITIFLISRVAFAEVQSFDLGNNLLAKVLVPTGWIAQKNTASIPLLLSGPTKNTSRMNISFIATQAKEFDLEKFDLAKEFNEYKDSRETFTKEYGASTTAFQSASIHKTRAKNTFITMGHTYILKEVQFKERAFIFGCNGRLVYLKSLYRYPEFKSDENVIDKIVESLECREVIQ